MTYSIIDQCKVSELYGIAVHYSYMYHASFTASLYRGDRFFTTRSFSGEGGRHRYQKQVSSDPYVSLSNHSSSEDVQHVIPVKKLSSLESPTEGVEMEYLHHRSARMYGSGGR